MEATMVRGIRIGRILEANKIDLYEQPVPTDWYDEWKAIADAVNIPVASGGGEESMRNFRWLIGNEAVQMVQQDIFYFGGMIRSMKVLEWQQQRVMFVLRISRVQDWAMFT